MDTDRAARRARLRELVADRQQQKHNVSAAEALSELLARPLDPTAALGQDEVESLWQVVRDQGSYHRVWQRAWGVRLHAEMVMTVGLLAVQLEPASAALLWEHQTGFEVPVADALLALAPTLGPWPYPVGPSGRPDVVLVTRDGQAGLVLAYDHFADADEFSLLSWGSFAVVLTIPTGR